MVTFEEYVVQASAFSAVSHQRRGQAYMNILHDVRPDLYAMVMEQQQIGWNVDPFHQDENLDRFLKMVATNWES